MTRPTAVATDPSRQPARPSPHGDDEPAIACTLSAGSMKGRIDDWQALLAHVERRERIDGGVRSVFAASVPTAELIRLVAAEQDCCQFFRFAITVDTRGVALEVRAPQDARLDRRVDVRRARHERQEGERNHRRCRGCGVRARAAPVRSSACWPRSDLGPLPDFCSSVARAHRRCGSGRRRRPTPPWTRHGLRAPLLGGTMPIELSDPPRRTVDPDTCRPTPRPPVAHICRYSGDRRGWRPLLVEEVVLADRRTLKCLLLRSCRQCRPETMSSRAISNSLRGGVGRTRLIAVGVGSADVLRGDRQAPGRGDAGGCVRVHRGAASWLRWRASGGARKRAA